MPVPSRMHFTAGSSLRSADRTGNSPLTSPLCALGGARYDGSQVIQPLRLIGPDGINAAAAFCKHARPGICVFLLESFTLARKRRMGGTALHGASIAGRGLRYRFKPACQLVTTMNGDGAPEPSGAANRNRLPSAEASPALNDGTVNSRRDAPGRNVFTVLTSTVVC